MSEVLSIIIFFLACGLLVFGLYWLGKLFFYLLPKKLKQSKVFNITLNILSILFVISLITINVIYLFKSCSEEDKRYLHNDYYHKDTIILHSYDDDRILYYKEKIDRLSKKEKEEIEKLRKLYEEEIEKLKKIREDELEKSYKLDKLVSGKIAYEVPDTMNVGKNYNATVIITKAMNDSILFQNVYQGNFQKEEIKVSTRVKAVLIDPTTNNFNITLLNTEEQLVDDSTNTVWKWNITPKQGGDNVLVLRVTVKVLDQLGENYKDIRVFEKSIKVYAPILTRLKQFISSYWQWLSTVIVIPLGIWGYRILLNRRKKNAEQKQEQQRKRKEIEKMLNITK